MDKKTFTQKYKEILKPIEQDFVKLDNLFEKHFNSQQEQFAKNPIIPIIKDYFSTKGKRIRSALIFLLTKSLNKNIDDNVVKLALAEEFIHNATLIHDDIIDCSISRRDKKTINFEHDSKLAVLAGDYLLTEAMKLLYSLDKKEISEQIRQLHTECLNAIVCGEISQYFNRFKILPIEKYIEKSKAKTAKLFESGLTSTYLLTTNSHKNIEQIKNFSINFGIAFQIKNDLENLESTNKISEDLKNGDYSAPIIFYAQEKNLNNESIKNANMILKKLHTTNAIKQTEQLLENYIKSAIENLSILEDNLYKESLINLCNLFIK